MSDSTPEDFMDQALALITELKKALEASFDEQDKRIDERIDELFSAQDKRINDSFVAQDMRINATATNYAFLKTDFEQHKNNHVSQSTVDSAIKAKISSHSQQQHKQELQNIEAKFISVAIYTAQINKFEDRIAQLEKQIETITQSTTQSEEGKIESKVPKALIETSTQSEVVTDESAVETTEQQSDDVYPVNNKPLQEQTGATPPSDENGEDNTTTEDSASSEQGNPLPDRSPQAGIAQPDQHTTPPSATSATIHAKNDPNVSDLKTAILQAIQSSSEYTNMINNKRHKILEKADELKRKDLSINDNILSMQVILALHYLINLRPQTLTFYKKCYQNDSNALQKLQSIIKLFIVSNTPTVTHNTFQKAINDDNFKTIITPDVVLPSNYNTKFLNQIIKPNN